MRERRSVVHLFSTLEPGGAEVRTLELIDWLEGHTPEFHQVILQSGVRGSLTPSFEAAGAEVITARFRSRRFWVNAWREARRAQALHLHVKRGNAKPALLLPLAWCARVPVRIAHFRSDGEHKQPSRLARIVERLSTFLIDRLATDVVGVSPAALTQGWHADWERDPRCKVLLSGVRLDRIGGVSRGSSLRSELGLAEGEVLVLHVGRDVPLKNRARAIEVFAEVARSGVAATLVFAGRDDEALHVEHVKRTQALGIEERAHFLGQRDDVPQLMADADVLLMTSEQEGMPGVLLESLAVGTPAVVSDLPGTRFVAERLPGVTVLGLAESDAKWASELIARAASSGDRESLRSAVATSAFDTATASREFVRLWRGRSAG